MVRFHVVNSVKGGCGKSTFSLYLANYLSAQNHSVVIIDLDIGGSTWYRGFKSYLVNSTAKPSIKVNNGNSENNTPKEEIKFINDLLYEYEKNFKKEHVFRLSVEDDKKIAPKTGDISTEHRIINVVMSNPEEAACIRDEALDLLECAIYNLVDEIATNTYPHNPKATVDIIFDMPPGYEEHSERILMHALMDLGSNLYKNYTRKKEKGEFTNPVYLYMLSGVKQSSLEANIQYVKRFYKNPSYSMDIGILKPENIFFILNDLDASFQQYVMVEEKVKSPQNAAFTLTENISSSEKIGGESIKVRFVNHIPIMLSNQSFINIITSRNDTNPTSYKLVDTLGGFKDLFKTMEHIANNDEEKDSYESKS